MILCFHSSSFQASLDRGGRFLPVLFGPWGTVPSGPFQAVQQCMVFFGTKRVIPVVRQTEKRFAGVDSRLYKVMERCVFLPSEESLRRLFLFFGICDTIHVCDL